jgi:hypothetical protein
MKERYEADSMEMPGKKKSGKQTLKQRRNWYSIKIILGGYLIYLAWNLGSGIYSGQAKDNVVLLGIAAGVFCIVGIALIILNLRSLQKDKTPDAEETTPEDKSE